MFTVSIHVPAGAWNNISPKLRTRPGEMVEIGDYRDFEEWESASFESLLLEDALALGAVGGVRSLDFNENATVIEVRNAPIAPSSYLVAYAPMSVTGVVAPLDSKGDIEASFASPDRLSPSSIHLLNQLREVFTSMRPVPVAGPGVCASCRGNGWTGATAKAHVGTGWWYVVACRACKAFVSDETAACANFANVEQQQNGAVLARGATTEHAYRMALELYER